MAGTYNSFIVRIWTEENGRMRGKIEHVTTHESLIFLDLDPVLGFISNRINPPTDLAPAEAAGSVSGTFSSTIPDNTLLLDIPGDAKGKQDDQPSA